MKSLEPIKNSTKVLMNKIYLYSQTFCHKQDMCVSQDQFLKGV